MQKFMEIHGNIGTGLRVTGRGHSSGFSIPGSGLVKKVGRGLKGAGEKSWFYASHPIRQVKAGRAWKKYRRALAAVEAKARQGASIPVSVLTKVARIRSRIRELKTGKGFTHDEMQREVEWLASRVKQAGGKVV